MGSLKHWRRAPASRCSNARNSGTSVPLLKFHCAGPNDRPAPSKLPVICWKRSPLVSKLEVTEKADDEDSMSSEIDRKMAGVWNSDVQQVALLRDVLGSRWSRTLSAARSAIGHESAEPGAGPSASVLRIASDLPYRSAALQCDTSSRGRGPCPGAPEFLQAEVGSQPTIVDPRPNPVPVTSRSCVLLRLAKLPRRLSNGDGCDQTGVVDRATVSGSLCCRSLSVGSASRCCRKSAGRICQSGQCHVVLLDVAKQFRVRQILGDPASSNVMP